MDSVLIQKPCDKLETSTFNRSFKVEQGIFSIDQIAVKHNTIDVQKVFIKNF